jgi:glutaredoxin
MFQILTVPSIKISNNRVINNETTSQDTKWQSQKHKQSKRSLPTTSTTLSSQQDKKPKLFFSPNRFSILSENEIDNTEHDATNHNEIESTITQNNKKELSPSIFVKELINYSDLRN